MFLETLIRAFDLQVLNYDSATRPGASGGIHSTIDLTLAAPGAGPSCRDWSVVDREVHGSPSDHVMIERKWVGRVERVDSAWEIKGWALEEKLEKEKEGERSGTRVLITLAVAWSLKSEPGQGLKRPSLSDESTIKDLEVEVDCIQDASSPSLTSTPDESLSAPSQSNGGTTR